MDTPPSPYVGPRRHGVDETLFGRDEETRDLVHLLVAERIVLLYSPSGAGKTSLLGASLLPALREQEFRPLRPARVLGSVAAQALGAGNPYVSSLIASWEEDRPPEMPVLADLAGIDLNGYLTQRSWLRAGTRSLVLVLDQFEDASPTTRRIAPESARSSSSSGRCCRTATGGRSSRCERSTSRGSTPTSISCPHDSRRATGSSC